MELQKIAKNNPRIDLDFDKMIYENIKDKNNFVITTWLGPWFDKLFGINFNFKIWVFIDEKIRAERLSKRDGFTLAKAKNHLKERDDQNRQRYLKLYNIDILDKSVFDFEIENKNLDLAIAQILKKIKRN